MSLKSLTYEEQLDFEIKKCRENIYLIFFLQIVSNCFQIVRLFRESVMLKPAEDSFSHGWFPMGGKKRWQGKHVRCLNYGMV